MKKLKRLLLALRVHSLGRTDSGRFGLFGLWPLGFRLRKTRFVLGLVLLALPLFFLTRVNTAHVSALASDNLNFQARLESNTGAITADGYYNIEFNLYSASTGGTALWTETYAYNSGSGSCSGPLGTNDCRVRVANGYVSVYLGSVTSFPSTIPWDQQLYLTMNVGGTTASGPITWDGEMNPRLKLTAVPYAMAAKNAEQITKSSGANISTLSIAAPTGGNQSFVLQNQGVAGTYNVLTALAGTDGYVKLQTATPGTQQTGHININGTGLFGGLLQSNTLGVGSTQQFQVSNVGNVSTAGTLQGGSSLTLGTSGTIAGQLILHSAANSNTLILQSDAQNSNATITIPTITGATDTVCLYNLGNCAATSAGFIQNQYAAQQSGNAWVSGNLRADTAVVTPVIRPTTDGTSALKIQNAAGTADIVTVDSTNSTVKFKAGSDTSAEGPELYGGSDFSSGWTTTGWDTTTVVTRATHTAGNTNALTNTSVAITAGTRYQVTFNLQSNSCSGAGETLTVRVGNTIIGTLPASSCNSYAAYSFVGQAANTNGVSFTPTSGWVGGINSFTISIKTIGAITSPAITIENASGAANIEIRASSSTSNTFVGLSSGRQNTAGGQNVALGSTALQNNTYGNDNTAIGYKALQSNTSGANNTALGSQALMNNISGVNNVALGMSTLQGNVSGSDNIGIGLSALGGNSFGGSNIALGHSAASSNTIGSNNIAIGWEALLSNTSANFNVAVGYNSLRLATGGGNTALGTISLSGLTTGTQNAAVGYAALGATNTGSNNAALGYNALLSNSSGSNNSALGVSAGYRDQVTAFATLGNLQRATAIGAYAQVQQSDSIVLGSVDYNTKVGVGITTPSNTFSVSPYDYKTGTVTRTNGSAVLVGTGTIWTAAMVGDIIVFADGTTNTVTDITSNTSITMGTTFTGTTDAAPVNYRFHKVGLQVTNTGKIGIGTVSPASKLTIVQGSQHASEGLSIMEGGEGRIGLYTGTLGVSYLDFTNNAAKIRQTSSSSTLGIESSREIVLSTSSNVNSGMKFDVMGSRVLNIDTAGNGTGDALFRNRLDSASAFAIQNSSNTSLFTADTTNSRIQVGSVTTDATAILFGLDSYNNGADPTGFNGAMYYNTSTNKFRCFENSAWANCAASAENVIQNQSATAQTTATFWIQGSGRSDASFLAPQFDAATGIALSLGTTNATSITIGKGTVGTVLASSTITAGTSGSATTLQGAAQLTANTAGNDFTIKGSTGNGTGNGGTLLISGGDAGATGTMGLVSLNPTSFAAQTAQTLGSSQTLNQAWINNYSTLPLIASNTGLTFTVPAPAISTVGRVYYISNAGTNDFNILLNGTNINIALKANSTATLIWNGNGWTAAGASSATDLQAAYNNTLTSAGAAELILNAPGGAADGLTIRNNGTPITGALFEVQSSIATNLFSVNNNTIEYAVNGGAENTTLTAWSNYNSGVAAKTTAAGTFATGLASVGVTTSGTNQGAKNTLASTLPAGNYVVSFAAKLAAGGPNTFNIWYSGNGTAQTATCNTSLPGTGYTISPNFTVSTSWTKVSCFIIVPSGGTATNAILIANQSNTSFYLDNLSVISNAATTTPANVQIGGGATGGQPTLFTLDQFAGPPMSTTNAAYFGSMYYDTSIGAIQCYQSSGWGACGSAPDDIISMTPEYTGAVLNGTGVGTMTADFCANSAALTVGTLCSSNEARNFYKWTSPQATAQSYSIYVTYRLPSTFKSFKNGTMSLNGLTDSTTNAGVKYALFRKSQGGGVAQCSADTAALGSANTWTQIAPTTDITSSTCGVGQPNAFVAGDTLIIRITVNAQSNASAYVENLTFQYSNK
ncbi:MAG: hypothetical protein WBO35_02725 [Candidatus Saccharimonadales bacterium]